MSKTFKVGDIVTGNSKNRCGITNSDMTRGEVTRVHDGGFIDVKILEHKNKRKEGVTYTYLDPEWFDLVEPAGQTIQITVDDKMVHAELIADGIKVIKRAKAVCSPEDTFDIDFGIKLALDRLLGRAREVKRPAKVGEYIKIVNPAGAPGEGYKEGDILKVVSVDDYRAYHKKGHFTYAVPDEYVVLENYAPAYTPPAGEIVPGTRVKIREDLEPEQRYDGLRFAPDMRKYCGKTLTILDTAGGSKERWHAEGWHWSREMFESIEAPAESGFAYNAFKCGAFAVHCDTREKAQMFLAYLHGKGVRWGGGDKLTTSDKYGKYESDTCYHHSEYGLCFGDKSIFESEDIPVIPFNAADLD